jgi:hypothetical protein
MATSVEHESGLGVFFCYSDLGARREIDFDPSNLLESGDYMGPAVGPTWFFTTFLQFATIGKNWAKTETLAYILGRIADVPDFGAGRPSPLIHMNGPRGPAAPAPLEPTAGVSFAAVRIGT